MNEPLIATIHALSHEGRGIASVRGKTIFIEGALPGETVTFSYQRKHKRYIEAKVEDIINHSSDRITAACKHFSKCGGCSLQHMDPTAQITFKQKVVLEQLCHFGGVEPREVLAPITGSLFGYRRRARLGVKFVAKKGGVLVGFREKNNHYLADLESCIVLDPSVGLLLTELKNLLSNMQAYREIPQIEVAIIDALAVLVFRHMVPLCGSDLEALINFGRLHKIAIYCQPSGPDSVHPIWHPEEYGYLSYHLKDYEIEILFGPQDFTQINVEINQKMVKKAVELLEVKSTDRILDLFCGLGNFTLPFARFASEVIGVEGSQEMVKKAYQNAEHNGIKNVEFYANNLQGPLSDVEWAKRSYDKLFLDPPRTGAQEIGAIIPILSPNRIVYVSCNPATLARDVGEWVKNHGYTLEAVGVLDMFPHTTHVESIALLDRKHGVKSRHS
jgi:23S rRNA (uracil1939-C5)-methyltransferase